MLTVVFFCPAPNPPATSQLRTLSTTTTTILSASQREHMEALHQKHAALFPAYQKTPRSPTRPLAAAAPTRTPSASVAANAATTRASIAGGMGERHAAVSPSRSSKTLAPTAEINTLLMTVTADTSTPFEVSGNTTGSPAAPSNNHEPGKAGEEGHMHHMTPEEAESTHPGASHGDLASSSQAVPVAQETQEGINDKIEEVDLDAADDNWV